MDPVLLLWLIFIATFLLVSGIDLFAITHRHDDVGVKSALRWTGLWVAVAFAYCAAIGWLHPDGKETAQLFITGYLTEYSLSIDNLFVFILIFQLMAVPPMAQPKLIKLGIFLAIVLRVVFIFAGVALIEHFHFLLYVFGALLLWTAWKMLMSGEDEQINPEHNILNRIARRFLPMHPGEHGRHIAVTVDGRFGFTRLFLVLLVIGSTDLLFALDSIPAIMGISTDSFVVVTSNVFAVLGLNSLFFAIRGVMGVFRYLKHGVSFVLFFIGLKMIAGIHAPTEHWFKGHSWVSLAVIAALIGGAIVVSILHERFADKDGDERPA